MEASKRNETGVGLVLGALATIGAAAAVAYLIPSDEEENWRSVRFVVLNSMPPVRMARRPATRSIIIAAGRHVVLPKFPRRAGKTFCIASTTTFPITG
jgi:hypothetical protein